MKKRVFMYWVDKPGSSIPAYVQLCLQTWFEHIPDLDLVIISHENLQEWVGDVIDMRRFNRITLPMQSDIVSMLVLAKHGGVFMDADTIVTKDIFEEIAKLDPTKLVAFGYPGTTAIHVAILISLAPNNKIVSAAAEVALERLNKIPLNKEFFLEWSHFSNDIFSTLFADEDLYAMLHILDRTDAGNILESHYFADMSAHMKYATFYFGQNNVSLDEVLEKIKFGAVSLHNSWTPHLYGKLPFEGVIESNTMLSAILRYALDDFLHS